MKTTPVQKTPIARYVANRSPEAIAFVKRITKLISEFNRMPAHAKKATLREMEMLMADATFGCDFDYCANLYEYDAVRGMYDACAGSDALSNDEIENKYSPFSK